MKVIKKLNNNSYNLNPSKIYFINNNRINIWPALDAVVIKAVQLQLQEIVTNRQSWQNIYSMSNQGGLKQCITDVQSLGKKYKYIIKTDIADFYKTINHDILLTIIKKFTKNQVILNIVEQYCDRIEIDNGDYKHVNMGIAKGGALSPLLGHIYLSSLDDIMRSNKHIKYIRYMDDIVILTNSKYKLRSALKTIYHELNKLCLTLSKPKTYIGRVSKGFNFLGYKFSGKPDNTTLGIAKSTVDRMLEKLQRLYEQGADDNRIAEYLTRWQRWVNSGLGGLCVAIDIK